MTRTFDWLGRIRSGFRNGACHSRKLARYRRSSVTRSIEAAEVLEERWLLSGAPIVVTTIIDATNAGDGETSLREALEDAASRPGRDQITFAAGLSGTLKLSRELVVSTDVDITGPGVGSLIIDGMRNGSVFKVLLFADAVIDNLTVRGGRTLEGGGIHNSGRLTLKNVFVTDNIGSFNAGGIWNSGDLILESSIVSSNRTGTNISEHFNGGGIYNQSGTVVVVDSQITGNSASGLGAGVFNRAGMTITRSTIRSNSADGPAQTSGIDYKGGGIYSTGGITLRDSLIQGNFAKTTGGGIATLSGGLTIVNSTISGNNTAGTGDGLATAFSLVNIHHSTITANFGTGIVQSSGDLFFSNSIIADNSGLDFQMGGPFASSATTRSEGFNLLGETQFANIPVFQTTDILDAEALLGPLSNNGGATLTHLPASDSPVVDAGDPNVDTTSFSPSLAFDQRGSGFLRVSGARPDIGATERQTVGLALSTDSVTVRESGSQATFTVSLRTQPSSNVVLRVANSDPSEATVAPATLTFTPSDWSVAQTVTVVGENDDEMDGAVFSLVTVSVIDAGSDASYEAVPDGTVEVRTNDDDSDVRFGRQNVIGAINNSPRDVFAADVDGDGDMDILTASTDLDNTIVWYENIGSQYFPPHTVNTLRSGAAVSVSAADFDGDGDMDVLSGSALSDINVAAADPNIAWYENDGNESFTTHGISTGADGVQTVTSVYAADLDRDGDIDVVSASKDDDTIAWYENNGSGSFTFHVISDTAISARDVYVVDVNGDGLVDVLSASSGDATLAWYQSDGIGGFTRRTISTTVTDARRVSAADFDGDGDIDVLAMSALNNDKIAWFQNDGSENFTERVISTSVDAASGLHAADVDGDGDIDVLSASFFDDRIAWYKNDGSGNFADITISTEANGPTSVFAADIDGDGDTDVLSTSLDDNVAWYENEDREFDFGDAPAPYRTTLGENGARHAVKGLTLGMKRDGEADGTHNANATADDLSGIEDDEDGVTFGSIVVGALDASVTVNVQRAEGLLSAWIDFNGDGNWGGPGEQIFSDVRVSVGDNRLQFDVPSVAISGISFARFRLSTFGHLGVGGRASDGEIEDYQVTILPPPRASGNFGEQARISTDAPGFTVGARSVVAADFDGDGDTDVLSNVGANLVWHQNDGNEQFTQHVISDTAQGISILYAVDVDGDGDIDVLSNGDENGKFAWYRNDGTGGFSTYISDIDFTNHAAFYPADVDGDGDLDVLESSRSLDAVILFRNDGNGSFNRRSTDYLSLADTPGNILAADINGDGNLDVVVTSAADNTTLWHEIGVATPHTVGDGQGTLTAVDLDRDGDIDILSASSNISWHRNDGSGNFSTIVISTKSVVRLFSADIDGDGDFDLVGGVLGSDDEIAWFENNGNQDFTAHTISTQVDSLYSVFAADVDGDGDLDVLSASYFDDKIAWYTHEDLDIPIPTVTLSRGRASIAEAFEAATVTATLSAASSQAVIVDLIFTGTAVLNDDYSSSGTQIVIPAGEISGTITVTAQQDSVDEVDETIVVDIDLVTNGIESGEQQVTVSIIDDDLPPNVTLSVDNSEISEASGTATVTATLSAVSSQTVIVDLRFSGTAVLNDDYSRSGTQIVIPAGQTSRTVMLTAVQDAVAEGNETIVVDITSMTNGSESGSQQVTTTIIDDDSVGLTVSRNSLAVSESGSTETFTVKLNTQPASNVVLSVMSSDTTEAKVSPATLTFTPSNWNTAQTVTVTGVDDQLVDGNVSSTVTVAVDVDASDSSYGSVESTDVVVVNRGRITSRTFTLQALGRVTDYVDVVSLTGNENLNVELRTLAGELLSAGTTRRVSLAGYQTGTYEVWVNDVSDNIRFDLGDGFGEHAVPPPVKALDLDGSGVVQFASDGLVLLAWALGSRGDQLEQFGGSDSPRNGRQMELVIDQLADALDLDGDGVFRFATDGIILLAYSLGSRGDQLEPFRGPNATRRSIQIEQRIDGLLTSAQARQQTPDAEVSAFGTSSVNGTDVILSLQPTVDVDWKMQTIAESADWKANETRRVRSVETVPASSESSIDMADAGVRYSQFSDEHLDQLYSADGRWDPLSLGIRQPTVKG